LMHALWFAGQQHPRPAPGTARGLDVWISDLPDACDSALLNQERIDGQWHNSLDTWLKDTLALPSFVKNWKSSIVHALSCKRIEQACSLAVQAGDARLATLIAQAGSGLDVRQLLASQLSVWPAAVTDRIPVDYFRVYTVLSGDIVEELKRPGEHWLRSLALCIWYASDPTEPLKSGLQKYREAALGKRDGVPAPFMAWHLAKRDGEHCYDTLFSLLVLACERGTTRLSHALSARGHSAMDLDCGMQWVLNRILVYLGLFNRMTDREEHRLTMAYVEELEVIGRWDLAIFVAQFLPSAEMRQRCSAQLLERNVDSAFFPVNLDGESSAIVNYLTEQVGISYASIMSATAIYARFVGDFATELSCWGAAEDFVEFCKCLNKHVGPNAVMGSNPRELIDLCAGFMSDLGGDELEHFLQFLEKARVYSMEDDGNNWALHTDIYCSNAWIKDRKDRLGSLQGEVQAMEVEDISNEVVKLGEKLAAVAHDPMFRSDVADEIGNFLRNWLLMNPDVSSHDEMLDLPGCSKSLRTFANQVMLDFLQPSFEVAAPVQ